MTQTSILRFQSTVCVFLCTSNSRIVKKNKEIIPGKN